MFTGLNPLERVGDRAVSCLSPAQLCARCSGRDQVLTAVAYNGCTSSFLPCGTSQGRKLFSDSAPSSAVVEVARGTGGRLERELISTSLSVRVYFVYTLEDASTTAFSLPLVPLTNWARSKSLTIPLLCFFSSTYEVHRAARFVSHSRTSHFA